MIKTFKVVKADDTGLPPPPGVTEMWLDQEVDGSVTLMAGPYHVLNISSRGLELNNFVDQEVVAFPVNDLGQIVLVNS